MTSFKPNVALDNAQIAELASEVASLEAQMAANAVRANNLLNSLECKWAQKLLASPEVRSAQDLMDACEGLKLFVNEGHALIERKKLEIEALEIQSIRNREFD